MRVSTDPRDPGHKEFLNGKENGWKFVVILDGKQMPHAAAITADESEGMVEHYVIDGATKQPIYDAKLGDFKRTVSRGRVVVRRMHAGVPGLGTRARE